jgi:hypothetical protein
MFWVKFPDGYKDFFSHTWATEHERRIKEDAEARKLPTPVV